MLRTERGSTIPRIILAFCASFILVSTGSGQDLAARIGEVITRPEYKPAHWGILIANAESGATIYEHNADKLFAPASTTKLFSCGTALAELGPDYRFKTPVYYHGEVKDGKLAGDLILVASGDLTFGGRVGKDGRTVFANNDHTYANSGLMSSKLTDTNPLLAFDNLAKQIVKAGIKAIDGEIQIDDRLFNRARGSGSGPDVLTPMIVNDNVLDIIVAPGERPGDPARVKMRPETAYFQMDADVKTVEAGQPLELTIQDSSQLAFTVRGQIAVGSEPVVRLFFIGDPVRFARALFIEALRRQNIHCDAALYGPAHSCLPRPADYDAMTKVASYESAPLAEAIKVTLKVSHNLYASTLPLLIAARHEERNFEDGMRRQGAFLKKLGMAPDTLSFASGAGGAAADAVTPAATVKFLQAMAKRPESTAFFDALPVLGVDGTLAEVLVGESPARGKAKAKTGTLVYYDAMNARMLLRSKALAGELETAKGTRLFFAIFLNDLPLPRGAAAAREGKQIAKLCEIIYEHGP